MISSFTSVNLINLALLDNRFFWGSSEELIGENFHQMSLLFLF